MATEIITQSTLINLTPDLNEFNFGVAQLINNTRTTRSQTKIGIIPNPLFELKREEWRKRDLQREREIEIKKQKVDKLPVFEFENDTIKKWIEKDKGYFKIETYQKYINTIDEIEKEINVIWEVSEIEGDLGVFWTKKDGNKRLFTEYVRVDKKLWRNIHEFNHYVEPQKIHDRNYAIAEIRDKHLSKTKRGPKYYEMQANYYYEKDENDEAYQSFLKEVQEKGLVVKKLENKRLDTITEQLFKLGLIKGTNAEGLDEDNCYSLEDLDKFRKVEDLVTTEKEEVLD